MNKYINNFLIRCFIMPGSFYTRFGVDLTHLRAILQVKLMIDDRTLTGLNKVRHQDKEKDPSEATMFTMLMSLVMGLFFLAVFIFDNDLMRLVMYFTIFGFMLSMMLITDFSHILIDVKDNYIILPKPVTSQTFLIARFLHIIIHLTKILIPMALPGWIAIWINKGLWGAMVFIPVMVLLTMLIFACVNAVYLLIIRIFSPAKINAIIASLQIIFSVVLFGSFQILSRLINKSMLEELDLSQMAVMWLFPTYWLAGAWIYLYSFEPDPQLILSLVLSVLVPVIAVWVMVKYLAPAFFRKLSMINAGVGGDEESEKNKKERSQSGGGLISTISRIWTSAGIERQSFLITWRLMGRIRDFKLKVYPQIGYMVVLIVMLVIRGEGKVDPNAMLEWTGWTKSTILIAIYISIQVYISAVYQLPFYSNFRAAWMYDSSPLIRPGVVLRGAVKACLVRFFMPVLLILAILGISFYGFRLIPNLLFGFGNIFLFSVLYSYAVVNKFPFSVSPQLASGNTAMRNILIFFMLLLLGVPHYFLFDFPWVLCIGSVLTIGGGLGVLYFMKWIGWGYLRGVRG